MTILTVSQLNKYVKSVLDYDGNLKNIYVTGEISNLKIHYSGHIYFTLKDENSELRAVMFKGSAMRLRFRPENGMNILARGSLTVYESKGQYQIICDDLQPDGVGALTVAFEQLKKKLDSEGLFDPEHKKSVPQMPEKIGVVTASTGAAIHDILSILERRFPLAKILFVPVAVQGVHAAGEIARAVDLLSESDCDVIIVGRGGGSTEDLWAFNEEIVARSIYKCKIPVVSAVGHETDFTISDFVADLRAATPSAAAEICSADWKDISYTIDAITESIQYRICSIISCAESELNDCSIRITLYSPERKLSAFEQASESAMASINRAITDMVVGAYNELRLLTVKIDAHNPAKLLSRGFASVRDSKGNTVKGISQLSICESIELRFEDGVARCMVNELEKTNG